MSARRRPAGPAAPTVGRIISYSADGRTADSQERVYERLAAHLAVPQTPDGHRNLALIFSGQSEETRETFVVDSVTQLLVSTHSPPPGGTQYGTTAETPSVLVCQFNIVGKLQMFNVASGDPRSRVLIFSPLIEAQREVYHVMADVMDDRQTGTAAITCTPDMFKEGGDVGAQVVDVAGTTITVADLVERLLRY
jgi:hypothetical protein